MVQTLVVFGITGQQGGSVANHVLMSADLHQQFHIRGVTRDTSSQKAQAFKSQGVELYKADWSDPKSLTAALEGAHATFIVTTAAGFDGEGKSREAIHAKMCVDAAITAGVEYLIFSTLPDVIKISNGRYRSIQNFNAKAEVEEYIRAKPIHSAFVASGRFMQNYVGKLGPKKLQSNGPWMIREMFSSEEQIPLVDIEADMGKLVGVILRNFKTFEGKTLAVAENLYSMKQIAKALSESAGQEVEYEQLSEATMRQNLPPQAADTFVEAQKFQKEFGFYGPDTAKQILWTRESTKVSMNTFENFLRKNRWLHE